MTMMMKLLAGAAGLAAIAAANPASAQYYGYNNYYGSSYGNYYGAYGMNTAVASQQCTAAVQSRLYNRTSLAGILGSLVGVNVGTGRVLSVTAERPTRYGMTVRGLATSGRYAYSPYGAGYYGALGYSYRPDLSFRCNVDRNGYVRSVRINRR